LVFAIVFFSSKYVSLSSILTSWVAPAFILLFVYLFKHYNVPLFLYLFEIFICKLNKNSSNLNYLGLFTHVVFILSAIIILIRHKQNIINIQNHVEKKFTFKSKKS
jgi:glycerol-3-phosphate acyltransferase PlsY